ncbi:MAG TPA: hypothetical protein VGT02_08845 [Methylomirabilota bacterium]|jgi:hypothetical protein|nr:hypothetical protein [Methylomirabilota bacterium]
MNERLKTVLVLFALAPLLAGGGGFSGSGFTTVLPAAVNAHIVVDPHDTTPTARRASIRVTRGGASASAFFAVPEGFSVASFGCDTSPAVMDQRFLSVPNVRHVPLNVFVPDAILADVLTRVGLTGVFANGGNAAITSYDHAVCTPPVDGSHAAVVGPGILSFHARIHLVN